MLWPDPETRTAPCSVRLSSKTAHLVLFLLNMLKMEGQGLWSIAWQQIYMHVKRETRLKWCQSWLMVATYRNTCNIIIQMPQYLQKLQIATVSISKQLYKLGNLCQKLLMWMLSVLPGLSIIFVGIHFHILLFEATDISSLFRVLFWIMKVSISPALPSLLRVSQVATNSPLQWKMALPVLKF